MTFEEMYNKIDRDVVTGLIRRGHLQFPKSNTVSIRDTYITQDLLDNIILTLDFAHVLTASQMNIYTENPSMYRGTGYTLNKRAGIPKIDFLDLLVDTPEIFYKILGNSIKTIKDLYSDDAIFYLLDKTFKYWCINFTIMNCEGEKKLDVAYNTVRTLFGGKSTITNSYLPTLALEHEFGDKVKEDIDMNVTGSVVGIHVNSYPSGGYLHLNSSDTKLSIILSNSKFTVNTEDKGYQDTLFCALKLLHLNSLAYKGFEIKNDCLCNGVFPRANNPEIEQVLTEALNSRACTIKIPVILVDPDKVKEHQENSTGLLIEEDTFGIRDYTYREKVKALPLEEFSSIDYSYARLASFVFMLNKSSFSMVTADEGIYIQKTDKDQNIDIFALSTKSLTVYSLIRSLMDKHTTVISKERLAEIYYNNTNNSAVSLEPSLTITSALVSNCKSNLRALVESMYFFAESDITYMQY